ncbi:glyoxalase/bleomycin resistance/extradiol dioxygenase family protein [Mesorhizobium sp.]|uniref:VOC family protein n=1 Tax=Mesorhizobium sp. TaxID=1871066 RepID=UPI000FE8EE02|nr:VOC family protein [Mesorhizobium sp.]RWA60454.1 MAG: VOC family protein [Mesorhizobium sp.]RWA77885.1 MAG: VOC family protein [Mesorhizobium sp.]
MAMKRSKTPWMKAEDFGRSLPHGLGVNLLVTDMAAMEAFCHDVLGARIIYADEDFAAIELLGSIFMLHADHSYLDNSMTGVIAGAETRGAGIELRLYGADPDAVEKKAAAFGHIVLAGSIDKPHGLRECYIVGPDGYVFVPSARLQA